MGFSSSFFFKRKRLKSILTAIESERGARKRFFLFYISAKTYNWGTRGFYVLVRSAAEPFEKADVFFFLLLSRRSTDIAVALLHSIESLHHTTVPFKKGEKRKKSRFSSSWLLLPERTEGPSVLCLQRKKTLSIDPTTDRVPLAPGERVCFVCTPPIYI